MKKYKKKLRKSDACLNCGRDLGDFNYCPDCGQINTHKQISLLQIIKDLVGDYFTFDSKFFRSFIPLIKQPGHLTTEYIVGKRATYILPMRLFVFTTALFFFMLALTSQDDSISDYENKKIKNPTDTLNVLFNKHDNNLSEETQALIIDEIITRYDIHSTDRSFSKKQIKLNNKIKSYKLKISDTAAEYFVLKLISDFRLRNKIGEYYDYENMNPDSLRSAILEQTKVEIENEVVKVPKKKKKKQDQKVLDSLHTFIKKYAPEGVNKNDRFFNYVKDNHFITFRGKKRGPQFTVMGGDTSNSEIIKRIEEKGVKLAEAGKLGQKIFLLQFMNHTPKLVFFMVPF